MNINSPDNVVGRDYVEEAPLKETPQMRAILKALAKIQAHKLKLRLAFDDRVSLEELGLSPELTVKYHIKEIRCWRYILENIS